MIIKAIITSPTNPSLDKIKELYPNVEIIFKKNFFVNDDDFVFHLDRSFEPVYIWG